MGDGHEKLETGTTFVLTRKLAHGQRATLADGGGDLYYGSSIRVSGAREASRLVSVRTWKGRFHVATLAQPDRVQICCKGTCFHCSPVDPCTGGVEPLIAGDKLIELAADVSLKRTEDFDELRVSDRERIALLAGDKLSGDELARQLEPWHKAAFGTERQVVYHLYHISAETTRGGRPASGAFDLVGKVLAIPVEPTPEPPPPVAVTRHG